MPRTLRRALALAVSATALAIAVPATTTASASPADASYTVTLGSKGTWNYATDTPASPYIDKDGSFWFQQSASLYNATDPHYWDFYTGSDFDTASRNATVSNYVNPANTNDKNNDTTWRCNNSPTGLTASVKAGGYPNKNYCDLYGVWVDPDSGDWYGLVHNEFTMEPFNDNVHYDSIDYAVSTDQGKTWAIKDHAITSPYSTTRGDNTAFPNQTYYYGDGDQRLFVDTASGYFYVFYGSRAVDKSGGWTGLYEHVARAPIASKMASGSWQKWYNGAWSEPGTGGRESNMVPVDSTSTTGYTPVAKEYNPANTGTGSQQIAAGTMPPTSPLFVMDITYNAYLGLYIAEPQAVDQSGNAPQQYYATDDLTTQKWYPIGNTGSYHTASWYRWFVDSASRTGSGIVGKDFRAYCSIACSNGSSGEYLNVSITSTGPAPVPVDTSKSYRIASGGGRTLAQASGSSATTSLATATGSALESWTFTGNGDGSYRIANGSTGQLLGVDSTTAAGRAWGAKPTVTAAPAGGPSVGQQWWVIPGKTTAGTGTGTVKIVNRYSGLVIGLSSDATRLTETTPTRTWTNTTGNTVGGTRNAGEQTLTLTPIGSGTTTLDGTHTVTASGKALDDPNSSTAPGTQLVTWSPNNGANQNWIFTRQSDGTYQIASALSQLCMDVSGGSTAPGAQVIQWTCTGGRNQRWSVTALPGGGYTIASQQSGLLLTTASTNDPAAVTQQNDTGSALQHWTVN